MIGENISESPQIIRPEYRLYNPDFKGNNKIFWLINIFAIILFFLYSIYALDSIVTIFSKDNVSSRWINFMLMLIEMGISYYSIFLFVHIGRGFREIIHPLNNEFTIDNIQDKDPDDFPKVSILLALYKEPISVVRQSILAALDLNYPPQKVEVLVADDTPMNTELKAFCEKMQVKYVTRKNRDGFKAGGTNNALKKATGEYVLFIDADHILEKNIIKNSLMAWRKDTIAVQTRIDFVNMRTALTTLAAFLQLQFFSLLQRARRSTGSAIFAGGAALFKVDLLQKFGGFDPLTIADDTDNSFIFRANGYRIEYIDTVGAWALVPWDPMHLIRQVWRWMTGVTRSFRARWLMILTSRKTPLYVKLDHFSAAFLPTLSLLGWGSAIPMIILIILEQPIIRSPLIVNYIFFAIVLSISSSASFVTGMGALLLDNKNILIHKKPFLTKIFTYLLFYALVLAAQPFLIGAILKGLIGTKVTFNRTPKVKNSADSDLKQMKNHYLRYTIANFVLGIIFVSFAFSVGSLDTRSVTLLFSAYATIIPLFIVLAWYWKLEGYLDRVADQTALEFLEETVEKGIIGD